MITDQTIREFGWALELPSYYCLEHEKLRNHLGRLHFSDHVDQATRTGFIEEHPKALGQAPNSLVTRVTQLLKQGRIFIQVGMEAQDEVKPILLYYGMSQVWGFFVASFVDHGRPPKSHGLAVGPSDSSFRVSMSQSGSFTRLVDLLAILGIQSEYSRILWKRNAITSYTTTMRPPTSCGRGAAKDRSGYVTIATKTMFEAGWSDLGLTACQAKDTFCL